MLLSLHVLPPAFNLPSIDAECLAAIAYLRFVLPYGAWVLVADAATYGKIGPFLVHGEDFIEGLDSIVNYLRKVSNGQWDLDARLSRQQRADSFALSSHLVQNFSPIVDLSLYGMSENYHSATRPAYAVGIRFPDSWMIPPWKHSFAQDRIMRLGFDATDLSLLSAADAQVLESSPPHIFEEPSLPKAGAESQTSLPSLARQVAVKQRLASQISRVLDPVLSMVDSQSTPYLFSEHPSLADCHLLALVSLALVPGLPASFLASQIKSSFESLDAYVRDGIKHAFGKAVTPEDALVKAPMSSEDDEDEATFDAYENMDIGSGRTELPWRRPRLQSPVETLSGLTGRAFAMAKETLVGA